MIYQNPIIRGFYPDPSVCYANGKFYLVTSSFQYFPGVPLFESTDLVNWTQIGHVLTRPTQVMLDKVRSSGGVFAPTIRYYNGRFYMVTNNNSTNRNFYVYTDDIYGQWSEPIEVDQDGIDPSLYFEDGRAYFITNGYDEKTQDSGVIQCEIDINTGKRLSDSVCIWHGTGGRYLESPHMYQIGDYYYIMVAEGGTEYGHMITYARGKDIWGPFENFPDNPVLTNRNKAPYIIQAIGHGDLIQNTDGSWYMISLGFRQIDEWKPFHHLGREVYMTPVNFGGDGWFRAGHDGTTDEAYEIPGDFMQLRKNNYTFENTDWNLDWCYLRKMNPAHYKLFDDHIILQGTDISLYDVDSPTFIGMRQLDFDMQTKVCVSLNRPADRNDENNKNDANHAEGALTPMAGITVYMCETEHYDIAVQKEDDDYYAVLYLNIGSVRHVEQKVRLLSHAATLLIESDRLTYRFSVQEGTRCTPLGQADTKYLSSEVCEGFTGTMLGLFAVGDITAEFQDFCCSYS